jgi:hypothetical protein
MFLKSNTTLGTVSSRLVTPSYPDTSGSCIRWYMLLENTAILRVRTYAFGTINPNILYTTYGTQGKQWKLAQVTVRSGSPYQAVFEGVLNTDNTLDSVAIDEIGIQSGVCEELGSCDFERGLCGFQYLQADFDWKRTTYNIEIFSAPLFDHTTLSPSGLIFSKILITKYCFIFIRILFVDGSSRNGCRQKSSSRIGTYSSRYSMYIILLLYRSYNWCSIKCLYT